VVLNEVKITKLFDVIENKNYDFETPG